MVDIPKSGCLITNNIGRKVIINNTIKWRNLFLSSATILTYQHKIIGKEIFRISDGWKLKPNKEIHLEAPLTSVPERKTKNKKNNIAGKTGTVQVYELPQDIDRDDIEDVPVNLKDHSLFVGFAPVDNPEIVVAAVVENVGGGSKYAAPIAMKIINKYYK